MGKKEIRKYVFQERKKLSAEEIEKNSRIICDLIINSEDFRNADTVYVYMDCKGEVSMRPLLDTAWKLGKKVAAPRVTGPGEMKYYYITSYDDVAPGYYDIPEPITGREAADEDALLIVPGVAFDRARHRCGYGQGFYDRYLSAHRNHRTVAAAFEFQLVDAVPYDLHDILPEKLVTEKGVIS